MYHHHNTEGSYHDGHQPTPGEFFRACPYYAWFLLIFLHHGSITYHVGKHYGSQQAGTFICHG
jgi:hypothetical protein